MFDWSWIDNSVLAGMSAALAFQFIAGTLGLGLLTWRQRGRFAKWAQASPRDRADAVLNIALFGVMLNAAYQRSYATYGFASREWKASHFNVDTAAAYLPWSNIFMAAFLWWMCIETFGITRNRSAWWALTGTGLWVGVAVWHHF